eukprot:CAMPEP_0178377418 /NCGR_PEP_ID=MMETSP0689_2-20121128/3908_1 /TAXON_ID=160604 /ORGANISM="Amphidinium massartii, Strain CS-259" /LENGTH=117 /DNA_ID=CAMNT_0019997471 /DNA_START=263 /DNA_END=617 /DNA_ORIENTATION=-
MYVHFEGFRGSGTSFFRGVLGALLLLCGIDWAFCIVPGELCRTSLSLAGAAKCSRKGAAKVGFHLGEEAAVDGLLILAMAGGCWEALAACEAARPPARPAQCCYPGSNIQQLQLQLR